MRYTIILLLLFVFSFIFKTDSSFDQDLGRHIKLGEIIVKSHQIPNTNLFSYTNPDFPFINTHWGFEVFVYLWSSAFGLLSLLILKIIIFLFSVWLILKIIPIQNKALLLPLGFIFLHVLRERLELRPEIFSFLFTATTYYILEMSLRSTNWRRSNLLFILPLIQLLWINTHIYFFVGLILQVIFLIHLGYLCLRFHLEGVKLKLLTTIFVLSVIVSLINPNGLKGLLYPLSVNANYGYTIVENQTMFLLESIGFRDPNFLFVKIAFFLVMLSVAKNLIRFFRLHLQDDKWEIKNVLISLFGLGLALLNVRSFPYLVFLSLPAVLQNFGAITWGRLTKILATITAILLILESYFYLNGDYYKYNEQTTRPGLSFQESSKKALDFVISNNLEGPIFNNFDIGSYIIYKSYPQLKVFVDGRPEAYPADFFQQIYIPMQSDYAKFKSAEKQYNFQTIIFSHTDQTPWGKAFLEQVVKDPDWKIVYIDDFMIVLTSLARSDLANVEALNLSKLNPNFYKFSNHVSYLRLGLFLLGTQNIEGGKQFIQKTLQIFPEDPIANAIIGNPKSNKFFW